MYEPDSITLAGEIQTGYKVIVTALDKTTTRTYTLTLVSVNPPLITAPLEEKLRAIEALDKSLYVEESWNTLEKEVARAVILLESGTATQADIDEALSQLNAAVVPEVAFRSYANTYANINTCTDSDTNANVNTKTNRGTGYLCAGSRSKTVA